MPENLTQKQKSVLLWIMEQIRADKLAEEFAIYWTYEGGVISGFKGDKEEIPEINRGILVALSEEGYLHCTPTLRHSNSGQVSEASRSCVVTKKAYEAIESDSKRSDALGRKNKVLLSRITLKVLAWVAGIVGAVIAGLILYRLTS